MLRLYTTSFEIQLRSHKPVTDINDQDWQQLANCLQDFCVKHGYEIRKLDLSREIYCEG